MRYFIIAAIAAAQISVAGSAFAEPGDGVVSNFPVPAPVTAAVASVKITHGAVSYDNFLARNAAAAYEIQMRLEDQAHWR